MDEAPSSSRWPAIRAALLAVVIAVLLLDAAPLPRAIHPGELQTPTAREELRAWTDRLARVGIELSPDELGARVKGVSDTIGRTHRGLLAPVQPLFRALGVRQGWQLFANPNLGPHRFEVRVKRDGGAFERRYAQLDPDHDWWRTTLRYRRVRGCWGTINSVKPVQRRFGRWLADRIFEAEPDIVAVQTRMIRTRTPLPGKKRNERRVPRQALTFERSP